MRRLAVALAAVAVSASVGMGLAACSSSSSSSTPATAPAAQAAPGITCADVTTGVTKAQADLKASVATEQEAWVTGPYGNDLQALINATAPAVPGTDKLDADAITFNQDATSYLSENDSGLVPGWETDYNTVTTDINALASDCGIPAVQVSPAGG